MHNNVIVDSSLTTQHAKSLIKVKVEILQDMVKNRNQFAVTMKRVEELLSQISETDDNDEIAAMNLLLDMLMDNAQHNMRQVKRGEDALYQLKEVKE